jgi:helix-turn-helix protein
MATNRSTATAAQEQRIIEALRTGPKTTDQLREAGCYQTSARIFGLRARGYVINTELHDGIGADSFWHKRMARYTLMAEPLPLDGKTGGNFGVHKGAQMMCADAGATT